MHHWGFALTMGDRYDHFGPSFAVPLRQQSIPGYDDFCFQAEDGIRDLYVTGVQTCALPISATPWSGSSSTCTPARCSTLRTETRLVLLLCGALAAGCRQNRSEERRVGEECGFRE